MPTYTEGICSDGAAILEDGRMMTVDEILQKLNEATAPTPVSPSKSQAICSDAVNYVDWVANVQDLVKQAAAGCCEAKNAVMQFDLPGGGRRVEIQLMITDDEDEFLL